MVAPGDRWCQETPGWIVLISFSSSPGPWSQRDSGTPQKGEWSVHSARGDSNGQGQKNMWIDSQAQSHWFILLPDRKFCNEIRYLPASLCFELLGLRTNTLLFLPKWTPAVTSNASMNALCNLLYCHGYRLFWTHEPKI